MTFADEYQVQMFSGPFLEGSSDVEQCCDRNDIVCISYPGDFYEHQIPKQHAYLHPPRSQPRSVELRDRVRVKVVARWLLTLSGLLQK